MSRVTLLTKENITLLLAIIGFAGTVVGAVLAFLQNRVKIDMQILESYKGDHEIFFFVSLINYSRLPVSITEVSFVNQKTRYSCTHSPVIVQTITRHKGKDLTVTAPVWSMGLPVNLPALSGSSGYLYFPIHQGTFESDPTALTFEVSTNRHRLFRKKLSFCLNRSTV